MRRRALLRYTPKVGDIALATVGKISFIPADNWTSSLNSSTIGVYVGSGMIVSKTSTSGNYNTAESNTKALNTNGTTGWLLPEPSEMRVIREEKDVVAASLLLISGINFTAINCWCAGHVTDGTATSFNMNNGNTSSANRISTSYFYMPILLMQESNTVQRNWIDTGVATWFNAARTRVSMHTSITSVPDVSNGYDLSVGTQMFDACTLLTSVDNLDTSNITLMNAMFRDCTALVSIRNIDASKVTNINNVAQRCTLLQDCYIAGIGTNVTFNNSAALTRDSIVYMFQNLQAVSGQTFTLHATAKARLSAQDIAIAEGKGWTVK